MIDRRKPGLLSPCVCSTLRMVSRAIAQLYDVPQKAATVLDRYGRVDEVAALVAFVAGP